MSATSETPQAPRAADGAQVPAGEGVSPAPAIALSELIDGWVAARLVTPAQAERLRAAGEVMVTSGPGPAGARPGPEADDGHGRPGRSSLVVEALAYLGGILVVIAGTIIAGQLWGDLSTGARLALVGGATGVPLGAGILVPASSGVVGARLRAVLWALSAVCFAGLLTLLGSEVLGLGDQEQGQDWRYVPLLASGGTTVYAAVLWWLRSTFVQQLATVVSAFAVVSVAAGLGDPAGPAVGLSVWGLAAVWFLLGWGGLLRPGGLVLRFAAAASVVGALAMMQGETLGIVLALGAVIVLVAAAVLFRDLGLLAVGAVGVLFVLPRAVDHWFPSTIAVALALLAVGLALVLTAAWTARRRRAHLDEPGSGRDWALGSPTLATRAAIGLASVVAVLALVDNLA